MGAREELLAAAEALTKGGRVPFSPAELIAEARSQGSNYPDTTLRTFIVGPMCVNSPDNHAVQYGDLRRVGRGLYKLSGATGAPGNAKAPADASARPAAPVPQEEPIAVTSEWWWEGNVQAAVVHHLARSGWQIRRVADTSSREHGVDVEASNAGGRVLIEVKGYPSATYARGPKVGTRRSGGSAPPQARTYFGNGLLTALLMRTDHPDARVVLALPDVQTYRTLCDRTAEPLAPAGVELWLVRENGEVVEVNVDDETGEC